MNSDKLYDKLIALGRSKGLSDVEIFDQVMEGIEDITTKTEQQKFASKLGIEITPDGINYPDPNGHREWAI